MYKAYKVEFILGLIGSIIGVAVFFLSIFFGLAWAYFGGLLGPIVSMLLLLIAFICGFEGIFKLRRNVRSGGVWLVVGGGCSVIAVIVCFAGAWFALFSLPFLLTSGIMALVRKPKVAPAP
jgi:hypothetical protein